MHDGRWRRHDVFHRACEYQKTQKRKEETRGEVQNSDYLHSSQVSPLWYKNHVQRMLKLFLVAGLCAAFNLMAQPALIQKTNRVMDTKSAPAAAGTTASATNQPAAKREVAILA